MSKRINKKRLKQKQIEHALFMTRMEKMQAITSMHLNLLAIVSGRRFANGGIVPGIINIKKSGSELLFENDENGNPDLSKRRIVDHFKTQEVQNAKC